MPFGLWTGRYWSVRASLWDPPAIVDIIAYLVFFIVVLAPFIINPFLTRARYFVTLVLRTRISIVT